jgi:hypothetical protein
MRDGKPFLPYIYLFLFLIMLFVTFVFKIFGIKDLSDSFVSDVLKYVVIWIGVISAGNGLDKYISDKSGESEDDR